MKTIQERINEIIETRYSNYRPPYFKPIQKCHNIMRTMEAPLKWWQILINFIVPLEIFKPTKLVNDEKFLAFLLKAGNENPKPVYTYKDVI